MGKARGLSLLEIVISVTILIIVFFTTFQIFILGFRYYKGTQYSTKLIKLAQDRMEEIIMGRSGSGTGGWVRFQDPDYVYMVNTFTIAPNPPTVMHFYEPTADEPLYDIYMISIDARGPVSADMKDGSLTQRIRLQTIVAPSVPYYMGTTLPDGTVQTGSSSLLKRGGMK